MFKYWGYFSKDEDGATAIEYALIAALIAIVIIGGASALGGKISGKFTSVGTVITTGKAGGAADTSGNDDDDATNSGGTSGGSGGSGGSD